MAKKPKAKDLAEKLFDSPVMKAMREAAEKTAKEEARKRREREAAAKKKR